MSKADEVRKKLLEEPNANIYQTIIYGINQVANFDEYGLRDRRTAEDRLKEIRELLSLMHEIEDRRIEEHEKVRRTAEKAR